MGAIGQLFDYSQLLEEQRLPSECFFVSFCTIFVLVKYEWTLCAILPKINLLCLVFFSNICDSRHLLVPRFQVEAWWLSTSSLVNWKKKVENDFERRWLFQLSLVVSWQLLQLLSGMCVVLHHSNFFRVFSKVQLGCLLLF